LAAHSPDNSFLGFVVPPSKLGNVTEKENFALIMGKELRYLEVIIGSINDLKTFVILQLRQ